MTLRDIERIVSAYKQLYIYFVNKYENPIAHCLYLHLLCLKYKRREWFESLTNSSLSINTEFSEHYKTIDNDTQSIGYRVIRLSESKTLTMRIDKKGNYILDTTKQMCYYSGVRYM
jgi:hypothetical protein